MLGGAPHAGWATSAFGDRAAADGALGARLRSAASKRAGSRTGWPRRRPAPRSTRDDRGLSASSTRAGVRRLWADPARPDWRSVLARAARSDGALRGHAWAHRGRRPPGIYDVTSVRCSGRQGLGRALTLAVCRAAGARTCAQRRWDGEAAVRRRWGSGRLGLGGRGGGRVLPGVTTGCSTFLVVAKEKGRNPPEKARRRPPSFVAPFTRPGRHHAPAETPPTTRRSKRLHPICARPSKPFARRARSRRRSAAAVAPMPSPPTCWTATHTTRWSDPARPSAADRAGQRDGRGS
jgi:hypothetical protein